MATPEKKKPAAKATKKTAPAKKAAPAKKTAAKKTAAKKPATKKAAEPKALTGAVAPSARTEREVVQINTNPASPAAAEKISPVAKKRGFFARLLGRR